MRLCSAQGAVVVPFACQFSSLQFKVVSRLSEKPIFSPPCRQEISPKLLLKRFQCPSEWRWPSLVLLKDDCRALPLSTPLSSGSLMVWCPWLCAWREWLKLLNTLDLPRRKPLVIVALPVSLSAGSFHLTLALPVSLRFCKLTVFLYFVSHLQNYLCHQAYEYVSLQLYFSLHPIKVQYPLMFQTSMS